MLKQPTLGHVKVMAEIVSEFLLAHVLFIQDNSLR